MSEIEHRKQAMLNGAEESRRCAAQCDDLMQTATYLRAAHTFEEEYRLLSRSERQEQA